MPEVKINDEQAPLSDIGSRTQIIDEPDNTQKEAENISFIRGMGPDEKADLICDGLTKNRVVAIKMEGNNPKSRSFRTIWSIDKPLRNRDVTALYFLHEENGWAMIYIEKEE